TVNASLVVDLEVQPRNGQASKRQIHTHGATAAMLASEGEYFHALRDARQKFSIFTIREILQATKPAFQTQLLRAPEQSRSNRPGIPNGNTNQTLINMPQSVSR